MANAQNASTSGGAGDVSPTQVTGSTASSKMRKRTKTGCLTCRKRRIKCGEERPTCGNCIKSKRQCEGYNQRVIFKPPIGDWPNHPGVVSTIQYHTSMLPGSRNPPFRSPPPATLAQDNVLTSIQPRPLNNFDFSSVDPSSGGPPSVQQVLVGGGHGYAHDPSYHQPLPSPLHQQPLHSPHHQAHISTTTASYFPQPSPVHTSPTTQFRHDSNSGYQGSVPYSQSSAYTPVSVAYDSHLDTKPTVSSAIPQQSLYEQSYQPNGQPEAERAYHAHSNASPRREQYSQYPEPIPALQRYNTQQQTPIHSLRVSSVDMSQAGSYNLPAAVSHADFSHSSYPPVQIPTHDMTTDVKYMPQPVLEQPIAVSQAQQREPQHFLSGFSGDDHVSPTQVLDEAAVENEDDDYWDVQSDEEMIDVEPENDGDALLASREFNNLRRIHFENFNELGIRRYDTFLYDGLLTQYRPEYAASPLRNPKTARVFAHYIHVTGPGLSIYERNPRNPTLIFEGTAPSPAQQDLWTYLLPLKALSHQGLLHAMLALASLHIARLQGASITPSYKHYAYSLKRLGRSLSHPKKRLSIPTLATSLLLAYYEVWTAEHSKWSTHLVGAAQLITEFDFRSLTREARRLRAAQTAQERQFPYQNPEMLIDQRQFDQRLRERAMMPDEGLVSTIIGKKVSYDDFGMILEENGARQEIRPTLPGQLDLRSYETLQDLYWYYTRHDMYQSIVSGRPLINDYRKWSDCPPRAPLGRTDALYGSHDHIILLLGRIADFTVRDRERKLRQVDADGGWRPRPGMPGFGNVGPPPSMGGQPPTPTTPMGPPSHMQGPPPGWSGPPPPGWKGPPPPGFAPPQGTAKGPPTPGPAPQSQDPGPPGDAPPSALPTFYGMAPSPPCGPLPASYENPNYKRSPPTQHTPHPRYADLPAAYDAALVEWNSISAAHATVAQILTSTDSFAPLPAELGPPVPGSDGNMTPFGPALVYRSYDISVIWTFVHLAKIILLRSHPAMPPAAHMAAGICAQATQPYATLIGRISAGMQMPLGEDLSPFLGSVLAESVMCLFFAGIQFQDPDQREWLITRLLEVDRRTGWASAGIIARGCETAWERAASMGRGPPWNRRTRRAEEEGPLVLDMTNLDGAPNWREKDRNDFGKGASDAVQPPSKDFYRAPGDSTGWQGGYSGEESGPQDGHEGNMNKDTRYIVKRGTRSWALNLLGTEEDLRAGMERFGL